MCKKVNIDKKHKIFIHNYKLPSIQLRLKTFAENNTLNIEFNGYTLNLH